MIGCLERYCGTVGTGIALDISAAWLAGEPSVFIGMCGALLTPAACLQCSTTSTGTRATADFQTLDPPLDHSTAVLACGQTAAGFPRECSQSQGVFRFSRTFACGGPRSIWGVFQTLCLRLTHTKKHGGLFWQLRHAGRLSGVASQFLLLPRLRQRKLGTAHGDHSSSLTTSTLPSPMELFSLNRLCRVSAVRWLHVQRFLFCVG
jgi:hypothetical protein